ncbi:MAG: hypothetical protein VKK04_23230 [Synechococcales bacterium]|nr:hypothetical protein [Synechococcales bacterium]
MNESTVAQVPYRGTYPTSLVYVQTRTDDQGVGGDRNSHSK